MGQRSTQARSHSYTRLQSELLTANFRVQLGLLKLRFQDGGRLTPLSGVVAEVSYKNCLNIDTRKRNALRAGPDIYGAFYFPKWRDASYRIYIHKPHGYPWDGCSHVVVQFALTGQFQYASVSSSRSSNRCCARCASRQIAVRSYSTPVLPRDAEPVPLPKKEAKQRMA